MANLPAGDNLLMNQTPFHKALEYKTDLLLVRMKQIVLIGLNHKTAPINIRECLAFSNDESLEALKALKISPSIKEAALISTCNRVEMIMITDDGSRALKAAKTYLSSSKKIPITQFEDSLYIFYGEHAVRHLFKVAASLDSMVVGEPQILGQIKDAYRRAISIKTSGVILNRLFHKTFFVAKKVRHETGIGDHAVSISYAAIELGRKIFGSLEGKHVLLIGAGEMAELAVEHLIRNRTDKIFVANRTFQRALKLAENFKGQAVRFEEIADFLQYADIIISSTGSSEFILFKDQVKKIMRRRKNRPLFFIDIAVPRDIDPKINRINNAYVYDIDDLKSVIEENIEDRSREAAKAERFIDEAVIRFRQWHESLDVVPTIKDLRNKMEQIAEKEIKKTLKSFSDLSAEEYAAIIRMTEAIVNKFLHDPTIYLKNEGYHGNKSLSLDLARKLFNLDQE